MKFWLASMKPLTNFKNPSSNPLQTACFGIQEPTCDSVNCSVSRILFWSGILMRLPVKYIELVSIFKEASRNFKSTFQDIEDAKNSKNHRRMNRKYWFDFEGLQKNYSSRDTVPLRRKRGILKTVPLRRKRGILKIFCKMTFIQHCFIFRPSVSMMPEDAGIEPETCSNWTQNYWKIEPGNIPR